MAGAQASAAFRAVCGHRDRLMLLVTVGTNGAPFDRLLREVDRFHTDEKIVVQHGPSSLRPAGATCIAFLPFDELAELVAKARVVVTHGGVGSILIARLHGKRPVVVPRLRRYGEAIDDHQVSLAQRLAETGLVTLVEDPSCLPEEVARANGSARAEAASDSLVADIRQYLDAIVRGASGLDR
jgi:UDP-N-acetylglucosamine transferase subunit ALG13